jgi:hypothetical protein
MIPSDHLQFAEPHTGTHIITSKSYKFTIVSWTHSLRLDNESSSQRMTFSLLPQSRFFLSSAFLFLLLFSFIAGYNFHLPVFPIFDVTGFFVRNILAKD